MYQPPISIFISLRYFWNQHLPQFKKLITIFSIISVSMSVTALIIMISIMNGFQEEFLKKNLSFVPHVIVTNNKKNINQFTLPRKIYEIKDIIKISNVIKHEVIVGTKNYISMGEILGIDRSNYADVYQYNIKNILYKLKAGTNNIIIGIKLARKLHVKLGDKIRLVVVSSEAQKILNKSVKKKFFNITGTFYSHNEVDSYQILMHQTDAANLLHFSKNHITGWRLWFEDPLSINYNQIKVLVYPFRIIDWKLYKSEFFKIMKLEKYIMLLLFSLVLIVISSNIVINLSLSITEKSHSLSILKLHGLKNSTIIFICMILGSMTTMIGVFFGILISMFLIVQKTFIVYIINMFFQDIHISMIMKTSQVFLISSIIFLCNILLTLYPAWTTVQFQPIKILSNHE